MSDAPHPIIQLSADTEQRRKPRISVNFPAIVRGVDSHGQRFEEQVVVDNLSAGGLYLQQGHQVVPGDRLFIFFHFAATPISNTMAWAARGIVRRVEETTDGRR